MEFKELKEASTHKKEREGEYWENIGKKSKSCYSVLWISYTHKRVEEEIEYMMNPYGRTELVTQTYERKREKIRGIKELAEKYIEYMQEVERNPERYSSIFEEWESFRIKIVDQEGEEIEINQETIARKAVEMIEIQEIMKLEDQFVRYLESSCQHIFFLFSFPTIVLLLEELFKFSYFSVISLSISSKINSILHKDVQNLSFLF